VDNAVNCVLMSALSLIFLSILNTFYQRFYSFWFSYFYWIVVGFRKLLINLIEIICSFDCFEELGLLFSLIIIVLHSFYHNW